ncbi:MAG: DNA polymerase III subunit delta' [Cyanothece sp. SIO1E1]|nr:DNA polymerase III subunit delta' [Cyanothece sp. SIO1E1]
MVSVFHPLIGQPQAIELLTQAISLNRIAPAYLFVGPPGVGRSLAANCFLELLLGTPITPTGVIETTTPGVSKAQNSAALRHRIDPRNHPDLLWVQPTYLHQGKRISATEASALGLKRKAPPQIRLEQVREITQFLSRPPLEATRSVVVLEQAETMAEAAANGLLKTLEEPGRATLILIAPDVDALLPTLVSRCQRIPFSRLSPEQMTQVLQRAHHEEVLNQPEILAIAQGSPGQAIASFQQLQALSPDLLAAIPPPPNSVRSALELAYQISQELDTEAQLWLLDYLQHRYWQQCLSHKFPIAFIHLLQQARRQLVSYVQPRLVWEVTFLKLSQL